MKIIFEINKEIIIDFIYNKIIIPKRVFQESIESVIFWIPVIWKDRDWDYDFLLKLMEVKIRKMKKFFEEDGVAIHSKKELKEMGIASGLLKRLREEDYTRYLHNKHDEKWGRLELKNNRIERNNVPEEKREIERKEFKDIMDHEDYMVKQDLDYFCKMFKKVRRWWD